jgi:two-component system, cell cycle response regulator
MLPSAPATAAFDVSFTHPTQPATVLWIAQNAASRTAGFVAALSEAGFQLIPAEPGTSVPQTDLGVLDLGHIDRTPRALQVARRQNDAPTLLLALDADTEGLAQELATPADEVLCITRQGVDPAWLVRPLKRLLVRGGWLKQLRLAQCDALTGLPNRAAFLEQTRQLQSDRAGPAAVALLLLDADHFKSINDQHGHATGDRAIVHVAETLLHGGAGGITQLARMGGEEFAALVLDDRPQQVLALAEQLRLEVARAPLPLPDGGLLEITVSIGIAWLEPGARVQDAFQDAEQALYAAKAQGRNRVVLLDDLVAAADAQDSDIRLLHFQHVTKVVTERTSNLVANFGRSLVRRVQRQADIDRLTQVWNRAYFDRRMRRELDLARRDGSALSIVVFDLDEFGRFNREHGMPVADEVLRQFAALVTRCSRPVDWFARYGGEEFVLVVPGDVEEAATVAERIRQDLEAMAITTPRGNVVRVTVTAGVAQYEPALATPADLVQLGSETLQRAKRAGRNRVLRALAHG